MSIQLPTSRASSIPLGAHRLYRHLFGSLFVAVLLAFVGVGCRGGGDEGTEWTVEKGGLQLTETLRIAETEEYYFAGPTDVAVRDDGRIYVADARAAHVKVLAPDGTLQDSIGRQGQGPGEFRHLRQLALARGDSLYVLDDRAVRVSVFAPDGDVARTFPYRAGSTFLVPERHSGFVSPHVRILSSDGESNPRPQLIRSVSATGTVRDTLFTAPPWKIVQKTYLPPFRRTAAFDVGPQGHIHYSWSDSLGVQVYSMTGRRVRRVDVPFEPVPVTEAAREREMEKYPSDAPMSALADAMPEHIPAFSQFLVDDEGRYWFGRPRTTPDSTDWWMVWPGEKRIVTATLSSTVELKTVAHGRAYGLTETEAGAPAVVRYEVSLQNGRDRPY